MKFGGAEIARAVALIAVEAAGAVTHDGMDDLPLGIFGRILVCCERDLARATAVRSTAQK